MQRKFFLALILLTFSGSSLFSMHRFRSFIGAASQRIGRSCQKPFLPYVTHKKLLLSTFGMAAGLAATQYNGQRASCLIANVKCYKPKMQEQAKKVKVIVAADLHLDTYFSKLRALHIGDTQNFIDFLKKKAQAGARVIILAEGRESERAIMTDAVKRHPVGMTLHVPLWDSIKNGMHQGNLEHKWFDLREPNILQAIAEGGVSDIILSQNSFNFGLEKVRKILHSPIGTPTHTALTRYLQGFEQKKRPFILQQSDVNKDENAHHDFVMSCVNLRTNIHCAQLVCEQIDNVPADQEVIVFVLTGREHADAVSEILELRGVELVQQFGVQNDAVYTRIKQDPEYAEKMLNKSHLQEAQKFILTQ